MGVDEVLGGVLGVMGEEGIWWGLWGGGTLIGDILGEIRLDFKDFEGWFGVLVRGGGGVGLMVSVWGEGLEGWRVDMLEWLGGEMVWGDVGGWL